jgi:CO/xanthine dehydrogenase FAD-binding subunit
MAIQGFLLAKSIPEALHVLEKLSPNGKFVCGGTDIMVAMHGDTLPQQCTLIDISSIDELHFIRKDDGCIEIGAATSMACLAESDLVAKSSHILQQAAHSVGSPQIRNRASIGGNIITAAQCADTIPALLALNARLVLLNTRNEKRVIPVADFFTGPKLTAIAPNELLVAVRFPSLEGENYQGSYYKLIRRAAVAKSRLNFAIIMRRDQDGVVQDLRISIGSALSIPGRFMAAEAVMIGELPTVAMAKEVAERCSRQVVEQTGRRWSSAYKLPVIEDVMYRQLIQLLGFEE